MNKFKGYVKPAGVKKGIRVESVKGIEINLSGNNIGLVAVIQINRGKEHIHIVKTGGRKNPHSRTLITNIAED